MRVTNGEIFSAREPLKVLMGEKMPVAVSYKLAKLAGKLDEQLLVIDGVRNGLIQRYGKVNSQGKLAVEADSEKWEQFASEFNELMAMEVEIVVEKVKLPDTLEIEANIILALEKFVEVQ